MNAARQRLRHFGSKTYGHWGKDMGCLGARPLDDLGVQSGSAGGRETGKMVKYVAYLNRM